MEGWGVTGDTDIHSHSIFTREGRNAHAVILGLPALGSSHEVDEAKRVLCGPRMLSSFGSACLLLLQSS